MPATITATHQGNGGISGSTATLSSITRAAGEALFLCYHHEYEWGTVPTISSVVWDAAGDNQAMTQLASISMINERRVGLYYLKSPTSAKTADITVTHSSTNLSSNAWIVRRVSGFDDTTFIRNSANRTESAARTNDLPITLDSATGDLVIGFGAARVPVDNVDAGDSSDYVEQVTSLGNAQRCAFSGTKDGAASVTITFGYTNTDANYDTGLFAVSIAPAGGGAASIVPQAMAQYINQVIQ